MKGEFNLLVQFIAHKNGEQFDPGVGIDVFFQIEGDVHQDALDYLQIIDFEQNQEQIIELLFGHCFGLWSIGQHKLVVHQEDALHLHFAELRGFRDLLD